MHRPVDGEMAGDLRYRISRDLEVFGRFLRHPSITPFAWLLELFVAIIILGRLPEILPECLVGVAFARTGHDDEASAKRPPAKATPDPPRHVPADIGVDQLPCLQILDNRLVEILRKLSRLSPFVISMRSFYTHRIVLRLSKNRFVLRTDEPNPKLIAISRSRLSSADTWSPSSSGGSGRPCARAS